MKKFLCFLITVSVCLSLVACHVNNNNSESANLSESSLISENSSVVVSSEITESLLSSESSDTVSEAEADLRTMPLLWKATSKDGKSSIYLFGSIHVGQKDLYPLPKPIMDAYKSCDSIAVECDTDKINSLAYLKAFMYTDGSTIDKHISADTYKKACEIIEKEYGKLYVKSFSVYKPSLWNSMIDVAWMQKSGLSSVYGIDSNFMTMAKRDNKKILEIESVEFQTKLLSGFSDELQEFLLRDMVNSSFEDYKIGINELYDTWCKGDEEKIYSMNFEDAGDKTYTKQELKLIEEYNKKMVWDRNKNMAEVAISYLDSGKSVFYIVGAAHMVGEGGIIELLEQAGYSVECLTGSQIKD